MSVRTSYCENVELRVEDVEVALGFYRDVVGLLEIGRDNGTVYLGCGQDSNYDLAVVGGGPGYGHTGVRARYPEQLDDVERALREAGVATERQRDPEPGVLEALRFALPSGHRLSLVAVDRDSPPLLTDPAASPGFQPLDMDHVNIKVPDVRVATDFVTELLGFRLSDVGSDDKGWLRSWTRNHEHHHDVGFGRRIDEQETLSHVAFTMAGMEHMKVALDTLSAAGYRVEAGPGRHRLGGNIYIYFREPGGNRFELSAEIDIIPEGSQPSFGGDLDDTFDLWGVDTAARLPASFRRGS